MFRECHVVCACFVCVCMWQHRCTFLEPDECLELQQREEGWGDASMDTLCCASDGVAGSGGSVGANKVCYVQG